MKDNFKPFEVKYIGLILNKGVNIIIYDIVIVGAGVIGGMMARELSKYNIKVAILEKENDVSCGASKANSGIIHGGFDPEPHTLKAEMNVRGIPLLYEAAKQLNVPHINNGSMVLAFHQDEIDTLKKLLDRGQQNGIENMELLSGENARKIEPNLSKNVVAALRIPTSGIICPYQLTIAAVGNAMDNGVELYRNFEVISIHRQEDIFTVTSAKGDDIQGKYLINCAGAFSDKISRLAGDDSFKIIPRAGEYLLLDKSAGKTVSHTIFQVPTKNGKGILVTPTADGNLLIGPTANQVDSPDDVETTKEGLERVTTLAKKSVPSLDLRAVITSFSGVRSSVDTKDFIIAPSQKVKGLIHLAAIDSPGLSSCVAIAKKGVEILKKQGVKLSEKSSWNGNREGYHTFRDMPLAEKDAFIKQNPSYGKIVCRCETVSEGEIIYALKQNPVPTDIDGIKRRTRSGMGRCQGGFCMPNVMKLISQYTDSSTEEVTKKGDGSRQITGRL